MPLTEPWRDESLQVGVRARSLVDAAEKRSAAKRLGAWLDTPEGLDLRAAVVAIARERGVALDDDAARWPGKRLLRVARGKESSARERLNPIRRDESFTCVNCDTFVSAHGRTARDHCPMCLCSVHVDVVPGDRAANCGGLLVAESAWIRRGGEEIMLSFRCQKCGEQRRNRASLDGDPADAMDRIARLPGGL